MWKGRSTDRRRFLGGVATAGVGIAGLTQVSAQQLSSEGDPGKRSALPAPPGEKGEFATPPAVAPQPGMTPGSDFMVDVLKTLNIKYMAANAGSSFRGLQESIVTYGANKAPEFLTCCHEESSVAMAHGYFKVDGELMASMVHSTVGVQHASMAIYNAFADRVPVLIISGNTLDASTRRPGAEWQHSVQDNAAMVRDYTKWDDTPVSLQHYAESQVRAVQLAKALPSGPVLLTVDTDLQENPVSAEQKSKLVIPRLRQSAPAQGDDGALRELARLLVAAERPVIFADRYARTPQAMPLLVELADLVQAAVIDSGNRANFPNTHPLSQLGRTDAIGSADLILALEASELWGVLNRQRDVLHRPSRSAIAEGAKVVTLGLAGVVLRANYQDFQRYAAADLDIEADAEASMRPLIEHVRRLIDSPLATKFAGRRAALEQRYRKSRKKDVDAAALSWDLSPVSPARAAMEVWDQVKGEDWAIVGIGCASAEWAKRMWPVDRYYHHTGGTGAGGLGYGLPAAVGAALAHRSKGRLAINFQSDGDFMYAPGALWTAAHHQIPLLTVMFNNRAYHQETMHIQRMGNRMDRGIANARIGTTLTDPNIDYAKMAQGMGVHGIGPITQPGQLRDAIRRALQVVKRGEPALIDIVSQPR